MDVKKLEKLKELKDKGLLSEKEFDKQVIDYINASDADLEGKNNNNANSGGLKIRHLVYLTIIGIIFYIVVETIFPKQLSCNEELSEKQCECVRLSVAHNVNFLDKIKMLVVGASATEISSYINFDGALQCSLVNDDEKSTKPNDEKTSSNTKYFQSKNDDITCNENEYCKSYYENGNLRFECNIKDGQRNGFCKQYYMNGNLQNEGNYSNGKEEGVHKFYYENGLLQLECKFKDGKKNGYYKLYSVDGNLQMDGNYSNNLKNGIRKKYYENGNVKSEHTFKNGKLDGIGKEYYENGILLLEENFKDDAPDGIIKSYYDNGRLASEEEFRDGKRNGTVRRYYDDGILQSSSVWDKGKKSGLTIYYNKTGGKIPSGSHVVFYYSNGNIESEFTLLKNGKREGISNSYYTNGILKKSASYENDKLVGEVTTYNMDGSIESKTTYKDGKPQ